MYYLNKTVSLSFEEAEQQIRKKLKAVGFGILTEIDMQATMKKKLNKDLKKYKILGACHPEFAYNALLAEYKIGILLPCNVTVIENDNGSIDISVMNPAVAMDIVGNDKVSVFATEVKAILQGVLDEF